MASDLVGNSSSSAPARLSSRITSLANEASSILFNPTSETSLPYPKNPVHQKIVHSGLYIPPEVLWPTLAALHCAIFYRVGYDSGVWGEKEIEKCVNAGVLEEGDGGGADKFCDILKMELEEAKMTLGQLDKFMASTFRTATPQETSSMLTAYHNALRTLCAAVKFNVVVDLRTLDNMFQKQNTQISQKLFDIIQEGIKAEMGLEKAPFVGDEIDCDCLFDKIGILNLLRATLEVSAPIYVKILQIIEDAE